MYQKTEADVINLNERGLHTLFKRVSLDFLGGVSEGEERRHQWRVATFWGE